MKFLMSMAILICAWVLFPIWLGRTATIHSQIHPEMALVSGGIFFVCCGLGVISAFIWR